MNILMTILWVAMTLFVCFKTTAVYEYLKILPFLNKVTKIKEYHLEKKYNYTLSYKMYMMTEHDSFFIRLITCPYCLGFWLSLGFSTIFSCLNWIPAVYFGGLSTYYGASSLLKWLEKEDSTHE